MAEKETVVVMTDKATNVVETPVGSSVVSEESSVPKVKVVICDSFKTAFDNGKWKGDKEDPIPVYKTKLAAGADLYSTGSFALLPGECADIPVGVALQIPEGYEGEIRGRSGYWFNNRLHSFNGTIDADYRQEVKVSVMNLGKHLVTIEPGFRVGQIVYKKVEQLEHEAVDTLDEAERAGGLGSTGGMA